MSKNLPNNPTEPVLSVQTESLPRISVHNQQTNQQQDNNNRKQSDHVPLSNSAVIKKNSVNEDTVNKHQQPFTNHLSPVLKGVACTTINATSTLPQPNMSSYTDFSLANSLSSSLSNSSSSSSSTNNISNSQNQTKSYSITTMKNSSNSSYQSSSQKSITPALTSLLSLCEVNASLSTNSVVSNTSINTITPTHQQTSSSTYQKPISNYYNDHLTGNGHFFTKKSFHKPTYCHHCTEMLWGIIGQGFICEVCNFVSHEKCQKSVASPCSSIAHTLIKNPVQHCWSEPSHFKRKFCNICRKRLDEHLGVRCEICEYYVHTECLCLAVNDCCETAQYVPNRPLQDVTQNHHWREGNLPANSKCIVCKKSCWTTECLAGMKCEWCGITAHSICRIRLMDECNFGSLRDIIVPPFAVSVPRIEMNKEAILGIQTNRSINYKSNANSSFACANHNSTDLNSSVGEMKAESNSDHSVYGSYQNHDQPQTSIDLIDNSNPSFNYLSISPSFFVNPNLPHMTANIQLSSNATTTTTTTNTTSATNTNNSSSISNLIMNNSSISSLPSQSSTTTRKKERSSKLHNHHQQPAHQQQTVDEEEEEVIIQVYDGNTSLRKHVFRTISVKQNCSYLSILEVSLRTFHINDDPNNYYLSVPISTGSNSINKQANLACSGSSVEDFKPEEYLIDETCPIKSIRTFISASYNAAYTNSYICNSNGNTNNPGGNSGTNFGGAGGSFKLRVLLRYKDNECENIRIYPGSIKEKSCYQTVTISLGTTVLETIEKALDKFGISKTHEVEVDKFSLIEVLLDHNVDERLLKPNDYPLQLIHKLRKESLCNNRMVRFYLQQKEDPHGSSVALFVGNLPASLSQIQYEKILMDTLRNTYELRWTKFDVIYYEYGSMVILYEESAKAVKAHNLLRDSVYEGKQLMVLLLPSIQHQMILPNVSPLLVFVNVKSGGQQGAELITSFRHLLNPHQVFDLQNGGPLPGLYVFRNIEKYRILACGGDGTIGWVLSCLDNVSQDAKCQSPPMAIVPLGTGNDLARVLRWGAGYTGAEEPINLLRDVIEADEIMLDRWTVVFHADENKELDDMKRQLSIAVNVSQANTNEDNTEIYVMNNYFGIGIEASVCLDFHTAREENPNKFSSRLHNKKKYVQLGIRKIMNRGNCKDFNKNVTLEVDGRRVEISPQIEGIIILNILSWGSGTNPWGPEKDDQFSKPTHYDGMLEVVGIRGVVHMAQIQGGLSSAIRLAQGGRIKIRMNTEVPVHVDGEPWLQSPCAITILKSALKATMLKKSKLKIKRRNTEPNINVLVNNNPCNESNSTLDPDAESEPF